MAPLGTRDNPSNIALELKRQLRHLLYATTVLYVILLVVVAIAYLDSRDRRDVIARQSLRTTVALCALRHDIELRATRTQVYLDDPTQLDALGLPPDGRSQVKASLEMQLSNYRATVVALSVVRC